MTTNEYQELDSCPHLKWGKQSIHMVKQKINMRVLSIPSPNLGSFLGYHFSYKGIWPLFSIFFSCFLPIFLKSQSFCVKLGSQNLQSTSPLCMSNNRISDQCQLICLSRENIDIKYSHTKNNNFCQTILLTFLGPHLNVK